MVARRYEFYFQVAKQFQVDRLQIILVAKKHISACRNCSSAVFATRK